MRTLMILVLAASLVCLFAMPVIAEIKANKMITTDSGLKYTDLVVGNGASVSGSVKM